MIICVCKNISESKLKKLIKKENISNLNQLKTKYGIGADCKMCVSAIKELLKGL
tara:strand:+ start:1022 stop:1183 length:162 start_codon:yes stop_codon:yes gene_type:complete